MKIQNKNTDIQILCLSTVISFVSSMLFLSSSYELSFAQKDDDKEEEQDDNKLVVRAKINLENVDLQVNEENEIVEASSPDEFFVCAYQVGDVQQQQFTPIPKFDCNEGDILGNLTGISLFSSGSQVYAHSKAVYDANLNKATNDKSNTVKIEILAPLADKKDIEKLVIAAMIRGQIKSEVIEDVQAELNLTKVKVVQ